MIRFNLEITDTTDGNEGDFSDVLRSIADIIDEDAYYVDDLRGTSSSGDVVGVWSITDVEDAA